VWATSIFVPSSNHRPTAPLPPHTELQVTVASHCSSFAALQLSRFQSFSAHHESEQWNKFANELTNQSQSTKCFVEINKVHRVASTTQRIILSNSRPHLIGAQLSQLAEPYCPVTLPPPHICPAQTPSPQVPAASVGLQTRVTSPSKCSHLSVPSISLTRFSQLCLSRLSIPTHGPLPLSSTCQIPLVSSSTPRLNLISPFEHEIVSMFLLSRCSVVNTTISVPTRGEFSLLREINVLVTSLCRSRRPCYGSLLRLQDLLRPRLILVRAHLLVLIFRVYLYIGPSISGYRCYARTVTYCVSTYS
jgi:hypothetical protein